MRSEQPCQNGEGLPIQVYGDRNLFRAKTKSKPACLHRRGARVKSGILNISIRIFLTLLEERVQLNTFLEKKLGSPAIFFLKNRFFQQHHIQNRYAIWSTF